MGVGVNKARGEVSLAINDETFPFVLTMRSLAELESALGLAGLPDLMGRLGAVSAQVVYRAAAIGLRDAGMKPDEALARAAEAAPRDVIEAVFGTLLAAGFVSRREAGQDDPAEADAPGE